jgi:hypothetical protein
MAQEGPTRGVNSKMGGRRYRYSGGAATRASAGVEGVVWIVVCLRGAGPTISKQLRGSSASGVASARPCALELSTRRDTPHVVTARTSLT